VKFTAVRVVCQNTLMLAMQDGESVFRVRHSKVMNTRLAEIGEVLGMARQMYEQCGDLFKAMAAKALASNKLDQFLEAVYPKTDAQKKYGKRPEKWERVIELIETRPDLQMPGVRGTLWGAYNGVTRFEDYRHTRTTETTSARLNRVWFGDSADAKLRALVAARTLLAA
jgi:phage/plasmid-like protein (TIGR03299 family)